MGPEPERASDVLEAGDLIRVRDTDDGLRLSQIPEVQGAFIALNPENGAIQSLTGGFSFYINKFNRALQAYRQPGSNIKPLLYTYALSQGYTPASVINDAPVVINDVSLEGDWRPENDNGRFGGPTRLREALYRSRNLISIRLMRALGIESMREFVLQFGFEPDKLPANLSLSLGSADATPIQVATAYAILANGGFQIEPFFIDRIVNPAGEELFKANPKIACAYCPERQQADMIAAEAAELAAAAEAAGTPTAEVTAVESETELLTMDGRPLAKRLLDERTAYIIHHMMRDVVKKGTGRRALVLERTDLGGKTGTTNDQKDAWFSGFNTALSATAWVGFDQPETLGRREFGSTAALPVWIEFMRDALRDVPESLPIEPAGIATALVDPETGLLAYPGQENAILEVFKEEDLPTKSAPMPGQQQNTPTTEELFR
jgi:penicillin-binding protein 1A